jgi:succinylglutamate desuccinylase
MTTTSLLDPPPVPAAEVPPGTGVDLGQLPRVLGVWGPEGSGPTLLLVAGLHGNEPSGIRAAQRVLVRLENGTPILAGRVAALAGNLGALAVRRRYQDRDLNRMWTAEHLDRVRGGQPARFAEDRELAALDDALAELLETAPGTVYLLDLHSASGPGPAFSILDDTLPNRFFALELGVPVVLGIEEELTGTLMHHLSGEGVVVAAFEAGQHDDPRTVDRAEAAIWLALAAAGVVSEAVPEVTAARRHLARENRHLPRVVEVRGRHPIAPGDDFRMLPDQAGFQAIRAGQVLAHDRHGPVKAREGGYLLMPLYQALGDDGFFLVRAVHPSWLWISALLRRLRLESLLHWLPGVTRHPKLPGSFLVDQGTARFGALGLFHLLGFRRNGPRERVLVMSRRANDRA